MYHLHLLHTQNTWLAGTIKIAWLLPKITCAMKWKKKKIGSPDQNVKEWNVISFLSCYF